VTGDLARGKFRRDFLEFEHTQKDKIITNWHPHRQLCSFEGVGRNYLFGFNPSMEGRKRETEVHPTKAGMSVLPHVFGSVRNIRLGFREFAMTL